MKNKILLTIVILIILITYGIGLVIWDKTIISIWIPWTVCGILALLSSLTLWRLWMPMLHTESFAPCYVCQVIASLGIFLCAFFALNSYCGSAENHTIKATVEKKYYKIRHRTRRVSRRTYTTGEKYYTYYLRLRFDDGVETSIGTTDKFYHRVRTGESLDVEIHRGLFGFPVIKSTVKQGKQIKREALCVSLFVTRAGFKPATF